MQQAKIDENPSLNYVLVIHCQLRCCEIPTKYYKPLS